MLYDISAKECIRARARARVWYERERKRERELPRSLDGSKL